MPLSTKANSPSPHDHSKALRDEILHIAYTTCGELANAIPEINYSGFSGYTLIAPEILKHFTTYALPQPGALGPTWNYLDAACQGMTGLNQLMDSATHRPLATKAKGLINISSNVQLIVLTTLSASTGAIGFAAAFGVGFTLSMDESIRHMRRLYSEEYFMADALAELNKVEELMVAAEKSREALQKARIQKPGKMATLAIKLNKQNLDELKKKSETLQHQIHVKLDIDLFEKGKEHSHLYKIVESYPQDKIKSAAFRQHLDYFKSDRSNIKDDYDRNKRLNQAIIKDTKMDIINSISNTLVWGMAFSGVLLLCIPGMQIPGLAVVTAASVIYLLKNSQKILDKTKQMYHFFKDEHPKGPSEIPIKDLRDDKAHPPHK